MHARVRLRLLSAALVLFAATGLAQSNRPADLDRVVGTWVVVFKGPAAHGEMKGTLAIARAESGLTGTLAVHGQEIGLTGQFKDGELKLVTSHHGEDERSTLVAKLSPAGELSGYLSGPMGDIPVTGQREKGTR